MKNRKLVTEGILICVLFFSLLIPCLSNDLENKTLNQGKKGPAEKRPEGYPDRIVLNICQDPCTCQAVTWRTQKEALVPIVQVTTEKGTPDLKGNCITTPAVSEKVLVGKDKAVFYYSAVIRNLLPDTIYAYRVGASGNFSEWNQFKTAKKDNKPFSFVYFGDPQEKVRSMCSRVFRTAYKNEPDASFWMFSGDLVDNGDDDSDWDKFFYALGWIPRTMPIVVLPGNHAYPPKKKVEKGMFKIFPLWRPQFSLPENGPAGLEESVYFFDYQGVRFIMLNGNERLEDQAVWMDNILSETKKSTWIIVGIHQPVYSTAKYRDNPKYIKHFASIFDKYPVDLVLQGHDHNYSRSYKIQSGKRVGVEEKGTIYVVSVSGPKTYPVETLHKALMEKTITGKQLFQVIRIDGNNLSFEAFDAAGVSFDAFTLLKK